MGADRETGPIRCPSCGHTLERLGDRGISAGDVALGRAHSYWCPAGCHGRQADGTFEFLECPICGSHDTSSGPPADGLEEVACNACGTISRVTG